MKIYEAKTLEDFDKVLEWFRSQPKRPTIEGFLEEHGKTPKELMDKFKRLYDENLGHSRFFVWVIEDDTGEIRCVEGFELHPIGTGEYVATIWWTVREAKDVKTENREWWFKLNSQLLREQAPIYNVVMYDGFIVEPDLTWLKEWFGDSLTVLEEKWWEAGGKKMWRIQIDFKKFGAL